MKLRIVSDLHLEFGRYTYQLPELDTDAETTLILAGDIGVGTKHLPWVENVAKRFANVIIITGNHEYYNQVMDELDAKLVEWNYTQNNIHLLYEGLNAVILDGVRFLGGTLWSKHGPLCVCRSGMNDFQIIRRYAKSYKAFTPADATELHTFQVDNMMKALEDNEYPTVVVTHHLPYTTVPPKYAGNPLNEAYSTDLEWMIDVFKPVLWVHGHTHESADFTIDETRVICNPRGYHGYAVNLTFDPLKLIEI